MPTGHPRLKFQLIQQEVAEPRAAWPALDITFGKQFFKDGRAFNSKIKATPNNFSKKCYDKFTGYMQRWYHATPFNFLTGFHASRPL